MTKEIVSQEISRLEKMGWVNPPLVQTESSLFLRKPSIRKSEDISFPDELWVEASSGEDNLGYWARHRSDAISSILRSRQINLMWEVGAGNGRVAIDLRDYGINVIAIEPLSSGSKILAASGVYVYESTLDELSLPDSSVEAIGLFDVLEHIQDPVDLLCEIERVLVPGGVLLLTVPAHQWLFSEHDEAIGHYRRYSFKTLSEEIKESGLIVKTKFYLFGFLVLPSLIFRRLPYLFSRRRGLEGYKRSKKQAGLVSRLLGLPIKFILGIEKRVHPFTGLSIIMLATKE